MILHELFGAFSLGTYPVRPILLVGYVALLWLVAYLPRLPGEKCARAVAITSIGLLFLIPLVCQILVFNAQGIPQRNLAIFITGEEVTNSRLPHNHFGKVVVATGIAPWADSFVHRADTGAAIVPYLPTVVLYAHAILVVVALGATILALRPRARDVISGYRRVAYIGLYGLVTFLVLEKVIDGGLVSDGAGVALIAFVLLLFGKQRNFYRHFVIGTLGYLWLLGALYVFDFYWPERYLLYAVARALVTFATVIALHVLVFTNATRLKIITAAVAVLLILTLGYVAGKENRIYRQTSVEPSTSLLAVYPWEAEPPFTMVGSVGRLQMYETVDVAGQSRRTVLEDLDLPTWYRLLSDGSHVCESPEAWTHEYFRVLSPVPLTDVTFAQTSDLAGAIYREVGREGNWYRYEGAHTYSPCLSRRLDVLRELLRLAGTDTAIVYGLETYTLPREP